MRKSSLIAAASLLLVAPAFAGDLSHYKITKPAAHPCDMQVARVYQEGQFGAIHVALHSVASGKSIGKLRVSSVVGATPSVGYADFSLENGGYKDFKVINDPKGTVEGQKISLSFETCNVMMS